MILFLLSDNANKKENTEKLKYLFIDHIEKEVLNKRIGKEFGLGTVNPIRPVSGFTIHPFVSSHCIIYLK